MKKREIKSQARKKKKSFELRKETEEAKGNVENSEGDVWVKKVRYSDDRKSVKKIVQKKVRRKPKKK
jgi:hypothetical protein